MSNLSDLKALYLAKGVAAFTDDVNLLEFKTKLDQWYNAQVAVDALSATDISSYSIAGRTVTRTQLPQLRETAASLQNDVRAYLYDGSGGRIDMSGAEWSYQGASE